MSEQRTYNSLDELAEDFRPGMRIRFRVGDHPQRGTIQGFVYSLPLEAGGRREPALLVTHSNGMGHVYPWEIEAKEELR